MYKYKVILTLLIVSVLLATCTDDEPSFRNLTSTEKQYALYDLDEKIKFKDQDGVINEYTVNKKKFLLSKHYNESPVFGTSTYYSQLMKMTIIDDQNKTFGKITMVYSGEFTEIRYNFNINPLDSSTFDLLIDASYDLQGDVRTENTRINTEIRDSYTHDSKTYQNVIYMYDTLKLDSELILRELYLSVEDGIIYNKIGDKSISKVE